MTTKLQDPTLEVDPDEVTGNVGDQDIDTAGTEADEHPLTKPKIAAVPSPNLKAEVPGDTGATDIVGPTGEQMPEQSHDGLEANTRRNTADRDNKQ